MLGELGTLPRPLRPLYAAVAVLRAGAFVMAYLALFLTRARDLDPATAGQVLALGGVGLVVGNLLGGLGTDRWLGPRRTLIVALSIHLVGYAALALPAPAWTGAAHWLWIATCLAWAYVGLGMFTPAAQALVAAHAPPEQRSLAFAGYYLASNLGMACGPLLGGVLVATSFSLAFAGDLLSTSVCLVVVALAVHAPARAATGSDTDAVSNAARDSDAPPRPTAHRLQLVLFCLGVFFLIAPLLALEYAVPLLVADVFAAPMALVGVVYTVNAVTILTTSTWIERRLRAKSTFACMVFAALCWVAGLAWIATAWSVLAVVLATAVWTVGEIVASIVVPSHITAHAPERSRGRLLALVDGTRSVATVVCPLAVGAGWAHAGPRSTLTLLIAVPLCGALLYGFLRLTHGRRPDAPHEPARTEPVAP